MEHGSTKHLVFEKKNNWNSLVGYVCKHIETVEKSVEIFSPTHHIECQIFTQSAHIRTLSKVWTSRFYLIFSFIYKLKRNDIIFKYISIFLK